MSEEIQEGNGRRVGRRGVLLGALGAASAAVLGKAKSADAAPVQYVAAGDETVTNAATQVLALDGDGLVGVSERFGIFGATPDSTIFTSTTGLDLAPAARAGVLGTAALPTTPEVTSPVGVFGISEGVGVVGNSDPNASPPLTMTAGVFGISNDIGVLGASPPITSYNGDMIGVGGVSSDADGVGVRAENTAGGFGLEVLGRSRFATAGGGTIPKNAKFQFVPASSVDAISVVLVTLHTASTVQIQYVERSPGSGFTIALSQKPNKPLDFSYLVVQPAAG